MMARTQARGGGSRRYDGDAKPTGVKNVRQQTGFDQAVFLGRACLTLLSAPPKMALFRPAVGRSPFSRPSAAATSSSRADGVRPGRSHMEIVHAANHSDYPASPVAILDSVRRHWKLIVSLTRRDLAERFKGSLLGPLWYVITPAVLIATYTLVFGMVFKVKVPFARGSGSSNAEFGLFLFSGLLIFTVFSDVVSRSTSLVVSKPNFVKKVVFPLEILSIVTVLSALVGGLLSFVLLVAANVILTGSMAVTSLLYLASLLLMIPMLVGLSWFLAALGTYVRDIAQIIGLLLTVFLFLSPVFTPLSGFPPVVRSYLLLNPVSVPIELGHLTFFLHQVPATWAAAGYFGSALAVMSLGWAFFQKTRAGFADVL
jgi:lipopolysaccharide transport system permease protein